jgi:sugar lactone lactonase YvrE
MARVDRLIACGDIVGESAIWCSRSGRVLWVDIIGQRIHALTPASGEHRTWSTPDFATSIGLRKDGGAIVGLRRQVARWDYDERFDTLAVLEPDLPDNRLNEGKVGPDGAFWVGTMQNNIDADGYPLAMTRSTGAYYRMWETGRVEALTARDYGICNTMAWADDGRFVCADTLSNSLYAFDYEHFGISSRRSFAPPFERGLPDGSALDAEGYLWNCRVGGGCIVRFAADGAVDRVIELPCSAPTSCAFGGPDLRTLYLTSARFGLPDERRTRPDEGALFAIDAGVTGRPEYLFG